MRIFYLVGLMFLLPAGVAMADDFPSLPPGPGRDTMVQVCSQCHSPEIVSSQRMDRAGWKMLVDQMANNGANATDAQFKTIVDYLTAVFPATPPAKTSGGSAQTNDATGTVTPQP
jgi:mono/diheme cytochrome c family protein